MIFRKLRSIFIFLILTTIYFLLAANVSAKDYSIKSADFKVQLNLDGSADVIETRTYQFDGNYSWADEWINLSSKFKVQSSKLTGEDYKITNFELWEGTQRYIESNSSSAGNFSLTNDGSKLYIKWYYRANFENKTFTLKYRILNAVILHNDISEFYWQLVGDAWVKSTGKVTAEVILPISAPDNKIWALQVL